MKKTISILKQTYIPGTRIILNQTINDPRPVFAGEKGIVQSVDDIGTIHILWDSGRCLGLIVSEDSFSILKN